MTSLGKELEATLRQWRPDNAADLERRVMASLAGMEREEGFLPVTASGEPAKIVLAAGGLVWRQLEAGTGLALVHRPRYDDWTLPKGKLDADETLSQAARREVGEETGCKAALRRFAGLIDYRIKSGLKFVFYWEMDAVQINPLNSTSEVDRVLWLPVPAARERLSYALERDFLDRVLLPPPG